MLSGDAQEQRPALLEAGDRLTGEVVVGHQPAAVAARRPARRRTASRRPSTVSDVDAQRLGELGEQPDPGVELAGAVVAVHHRHQVAGRRGDQVQLVVHPAELVLEHDHGEDAGAGADVAGARRDRVGGDHPGARRRPRAGTAGRRAAAARSGRAASRPASVSVAGRLARRPRSSAAGRPAVSSTPASAARSSNRRQHRGVVAAGARCRSGTCRWRRRRRAPSRRSAASARSRPGWSGGRCRPTWSSPSRIAW